MHSHLMGAGERGNCASCQHYSRPVSTGSMRCRREGRWVTVHDQHQGCAFWLREPGADDDMPRREWIDRCAAALAARWYRVGRTLPVPAHTPHQVAEVLCRTHRHVLPPERAAALRLDDVLAELAARDAETAR